MERRLLATVAATAFSVAALTAAVGATTHVFAAGDTAAGVGTISPVSTTTPEPIVEHKIIDIEDPAPPLPAPAPAPAPVTTHRAPETHEGTIREAATAPATTAPAPVAAPTPAPTAPHEPYEPGDD
jgi:hypothetical protein